MSDLARQAHLPPPFANTPVKPRPTIAAGTYETNPPSQKLPIAPSCAPPYGRAMLVTQEPERTSGFAGYPYDPFVDVRARQPMRPAYDQWAPALVHYRPMGASALRRHPHDEGHERGKLLLDESARGPSSLISPVSSSSLDAQLPMKISGLLSVKASRNIIALRRSRAPPTGPGEADCSATGLPAKGWFGSRETKSIAFSSPPGMMKVYSAMQNRSRHRPRGSHRQAH